MTDPRAPEVPKAAKSTSAGKLAVLMVTAFMDMVGVLMIIPLLPFYAKTMGATGLVVGLLVSSFSIAQLLMAPVWGRFSDHYGRRPALIVGMTASAIAYVIFAYADSLWLLFLSRLVQGAGGGTVSARLCKIVHHRSTLGLGAVCSSGWLFANCLGIQDSR